MSAQPSEPSGKYKYDVEDFAEMFGKSPSHIRRLAPLLGAGRNVKNRYWEFSDADRRKFSKHVSENGRNRK